MHIKHFLAVLIFGGTLVFGMAQGHAMLANSNPANNAVLSAPPKTIDLIFGHPTKLVTLKLTKGYDVIPLNVGAPAAESKTFSVALPVLEPGQYQVTWSTLSADGHPMKGVIAFTVSGK